MDTFEAAAIVQDALGRADFGEHLTAWSFRMLDAFDGDLCAEAVLLSDRSEWDEVASQAFHQARAELDRLLEGEPVRVIVICRTLEDHTSYQAREAGIWTQSFPMSLADEILDLAHHTRSGSEDGVDGRHRVRTTRPFTDSSNTPTAMFSCPG